MAFLALAESNIGKWKTGETAGKIVFEDDAATQRYNELLEQAREISARQMEYQRQALPPKTP